MIGTIIGAGIFGLPAAFSVVGFLPGTILFFSLAIVVTLTHILFAAQLLATRDRQRLSGLARRGLGEFAFQLTAITYPLQIVAANYAYLLLGGEFLDVLARALGLSFPIPAWQLLFWVGGALTVLFGLKAVAKAETWMSSAKILVLLVAVLLTFPLATLSFDIHGTVTTWFLPFGVFLFTLSGLSGIGEVVEIAGRRASTAFAAVAIGTLVSAVLCWVFGVTLFFAAHGYPIRTAADLASILPAGTGLIIPLLGFLAVATAYIITAEDLRVTFMRDFSWKPGISIAIALGAPLCLLTVLSRDFLSTIGFIGAVFVGLNSLVICAIAYKAMFRLRSHVWHIIGTAVCAAMMGVYVFGILSHILARQSL
jgi:tyrosine-specific transport protein